MDFPVEDEDGSQLVEINTTPLIDVLLVLLIMLIVTIPAPIQRIDMGLPADAVAASPDKPDIRTITVDAEGGVGWDGQALPDRDALDRQLAGIAAITPAPDIRLRADNSAPYHAVVSVLAACQRHGLTNVSIVGPPTNRRDGVTPP